MVDAQERKVRTLKVRDHAGRQRELDAARHREMRERHRRDRLREMERRVQRRAVGGVEQHGLQAELDRRAQRGHVQAHVRAELRPSSGRRGDVSGAFRRVTQYTT